ncbi:hypothetical protein LINPERPRIM_LOCUS21872 [Linum perenne]
MEIRTRNFSICLLYKGNRGMPSGSSKRERIGGRRMKEKLKIRFALFSWTYSLGESQVFQKVLREIFLE